jgi:hypothetical protein
LTLSFCPPKSERNCRAHEASGQQPLFVTAREGGGRHTAAGRLDMATTKKVVISGAKIGAANFFDEFSKIFPPF